MPAAQPLFKVVISGESVFELLDRVETAVGPPSLSEFLETNAWPHFRTRISDRFAYEGDAATGPWPPLSAATVAIKIKMGYSENAEYPNYRTEQMFDYLMESHRTEMSPYGAELRFPEPPSSPALARKIKVAQEGAPPPNPASPNFGPTPPRPVLALDSNDTLEMLQGLSEWIARQVVSGAAL